MAKLSLLRQQVIFEARSWLGTRWQHQGRIKRNEQFVGGVDCAGLIITIGNTLSLFPQPLVFHQYSRLPSGIFVREACEEFLVAKPIKRLRPGDILLLRIQHEAQHLALYTLAKTIIHAYVPARQVVEQRYDETWQQRLAGVYSYPLLATSRVK